MKFNALPPMVLLGYGKNEEELTELFSLAAAVGGPPYIEYVDAVQDAPHSMQVLSEAPLDAINPLPNAMGPIEAAKSLMVVTREEGRYPVNKYPHVADVKGWELCKAHIGGAPVIIAIAAWL